MPRQKLFRILTSDTSYGNTYGQLYFYVHSMLVIYAYSQSHVHDQPYDYGQPNSYGQIYAYGQFLCSLSVYVYG